MQAEKPSPLSALSAGDQISAQAVLAQHYDTATAAANNLRVNLKKAIGAHAAVVGGHRLIIFKEVSSASLASSSSSSAASKPVWDQHLAAIAAVSVGEPAGALRVQLRGGDSVTISVPAGEGQDKIDVLLRALFEASVVVFGPGGTVLPFAVAPESRLPRAEIEKSVQESGAPCGGYTAAYKCWCDFHKSTPIEDLIFDMNELYPYAGVTAFDFTDVLRRKTKPSPHDQRVMIHALAYNDFFETFAFDQTEPAPKEAVNQLSSTLETNNGIKILNLASAGLDKSQLAQLSTGLKDNIRSAIHSIDVSDNPVDDKSIAALAAAVPSCAGTHGLQQINIARTGCGKVGLQALANSILGHAPTLQAIRDIDISGNKVDDDTARLWGQVLAKAPQLEEFSCSHSGTSPTALATGFGQASLPALRVFRCAGNSLKKTFQHLVAMLDRAPKLAEVDLEGCGLPVEALPELFGPRGLKTLSTARLGDNDLGDAGLIALIESLATNKVLSALYLDGNFAKKTKLRAAAFDALATFIARPDNTITTLSLSGTVKGSSGRRLHLPSLTSLTSSSSSALKDDIFPIVFSFMTNETVLSLDVSGNQAGDHLALAIGKLLATNRHLQELRFDENGITLEGMRMVQTGVSRNAGTIVSLPIPIVDVYEALKAGADAAQMQDVLTHIQTDTHANAIKSSTPRIGSLRTNRTHRRV